MRLTTPDGQLVDAPIVESASFGARGQRLQVRLGNGVEVSYGHDPDTFRLVSQQARRGTRIYQDIQYTYDPVGNLVRLEDRSHDPGPGAIVGAAPSWHSGPIALGHHQPAW